MIVGPNGKGKSTLLKALTGLLAPSGGSVALEGRPLTAWPPAALARRRAVLAQNPEPGLTSTAHELVVLGGRAAGQGATADGAVARCLGAVDLAGYGARLVQELSGGERQRLHIALVLCQLGGSDGIARRTRCAGCFWTSLPTASTSPGTIPARAAERSRSCMT